MIPDERGIQVKRCVRHLSASAATSSASAPYGASLASSAVPPRDPVSLWLAARRSEEPCCTGDVVKEGGKPLLMDEEGEGGGEAKVPQTGRCCCRCFSRRDSSTEQSVSSIYNVCMYRKFSVLVLQIFSSLELVHVTSLSHFKVNL